MRITIQGSVKKSAIIAVGVAIFVLAAVWIVRTYLAFAVAERPTVVNLQAARRLDPSNSNYALQLGRLYQYSVMNANPALAAKALRRAVELNAYNAQAWLDLGTTMVFAGDTNKAEDCLRRVDELAPHIPSYQWAIGNFFLLHGDLDEAFRHFRMVLSGDPSYWQTIFTTAWKASNDPHQILSELVPRNASGELTYLNFLLATQRVAQAAPVWKLIVKDSGKFDPAQASPYIDALIAGHHPAKAYQVWNVLRQKGLIPATDESRPKNLLENGDFANQPLNMGFGWRVGGVSGVYVTLDDSTFRSPPYSLLIQFPGNQNLDYHAVYQYVPVLPNHKYELTGFMKTEHITTDSGPRLEVRDAYNPAALDQYTDAMIGTSPSWLPLSLDFRTGPKTNLVVVMIARVPSQKLDNRIAGKVWVDDVSLSPVLSPSAPPQP